MKIFSDYIFKLSNNKFAKLYLITKNNTKRFYLVLSENKEIGEIHVFNTLKRDFNRKYLVNFKDPKNNEWHAKSFDNLKDAFLYICKSYNESI